jgi:hypothetical protein
VAVIQISRIQHRRGLEADLPNLASAELGYSVDTRKLYIGNGTIEEGAPSLGRTEVLTQYSILDFTSAINANIEALQQGLTLTNSNLVAVSNRVLALEAQSFGYYTQTLFPNVNNINITTISNSSSTISYSIAQGTAERSGTITLARANSVVAVDETYSESSSTDVVFNITANTTTTVWNYASTLGGTLYYRINSFN